MSQENNNTQIAQPTQGVEQKSADGMEWLKNAFPEAAANFDPNSSPYKAKVFIFGEFKAEFDPDDAEDMDRCKAALDRLGQDEKNILKEGEAGDRIRSQCNMYGSFFDNLFGAGAAEKMFHGKHNVRICECAYGEFLKHIGNTAVERAMRQRQIFQKYTPNRQQRRSDNYRKHKHGNGGNRG